MNKFLSVLVTAYNVEDYIYECLQSILNQSYSNFEVIIINDGSTDNTKKVISKFLEVDDRFKSIDTANKGVARARNLALDTAIGDYIIFIDGDDFVETEYFENMLTSIGENDILICSYKKLNIDNSYSPGREVVGIDQGSVIRAINMEPNPWGKIYKKEVFKNIRYPEGLVFEDFAVFYEIFKDKKIGLIRNKCYIYRLRIGSIMRSFNSNTIYDKKIILKNIEKNIISKSICNKEKNAAFIDCYIYHMVFVTLNIISNESSNIYDDIKLLKKNINYKYFRLGNILRMREVNSKDRLFLIMSIISMNFSVFIKKKFIK